MANLSEIKIKAAEKHLEEFGYMLVDMDLNIELATVKQIVLPGAEHDRNQEVVALAKMKDKRANIEKVMKRLIDLIDTYRTEMLPKEVKNG